VDLELLKDHSLGLIALSGGISGEIPRALLTDRYNVARECAINYYRIFQDDFYLELCGNGFSVQEELNFSLLSLGNSLGIPVVGAAECHYLHPEDRSAFLVLQCIRSRQTLDFDKVFLPQADEGDFHFRDPGSIQTLFANYPQALDGIRRIVNQCNVDFPERKTFAIPHPCIGFSKENNPQPDDFLEKADAQFLKMARDGLHQKLLTKKEISGEMDPDLEAIYQNRLRQETTTILNLGVSMYFLIMADLVAFAKSQGIILGPGRGGATSSLVNYALGITDIDPIEFGLLFEIFLNPQAKKPFPFIDLDAPADKAELLINYLRETYGGSQFSAHSLHLNLLQGRSLVREVGRTFGLPLFVLDEICGMFPTHSRISIKMAMDEISLLKTAAQKDPIVEKVLQFSLALENIPRAVEASMYSLVISPKLLRDILPLFLDYNSITGKGPVNPVAVVQYDRNAISENGLLHFDIYPLKLLSLISATLTRVHQKGKSVDLSNIPLDDPDTLNLLTNGNFAGIYFLENPWIGNYLKRLAKHGLHFSDLVDVWALFPPLRTENTLRELYLYSRTTKNTQEYHPLWAPNGKLLLFQEDLIELTQKNIGIDSEAGELVIRLLNQGKEEEIALSKSIFLAKAFNNSIPLDAAEANWKIILDNFIHTPSKARAVSLALQSFRTAYLKAHFSSEFMEALLSTEEINREKQEKALKEYRTSHFRLIPPPRNGS
jgi:DNA polymerase-3 subunit alpha